jgi:hypothetical protein
MKWNRWEVANIVPFGNITAREHEVLRNCSSCAFFDLCYGG